MSKPLVAGLLAAGCLSAAAGGAYVAVRQNAPEHVREALVPGSQPVPAPTPEPVTETEAVVVPEGPSPREAPAPQPQLERPARAVPEGGKGPVAARAPRRAERPERSTPAVPPGAPAPRSTTTMQAEPTPPVPPTAGLPASGVPAALPRPEPVAEVLAVPDILPRVPERQFVEVVVPASSVIGLQVETSLSSERARVEDRVDARVTRDVTADGRVAIPAGSGVIGSVVLVERGGTIKERARLGVRFHTLVFADATELPIRTEAIYREGESPSGESARKIGGAAVGGAILGAILGGGKGAAIGGAAGAAGGTAATMAGDRNAASLPAGTVVTVRLSEPVTLDVEKREREF